MRRYLLGDPLVSCQELIKVPPVAQTALPYGKRRFSERFHESLMKSANQLGDQDPPESGLGSFAFPS